MHFLYTRTMYDRPLEMPARSSLTGLKIALVQLTSHPALKIGGADYLCQPYIPNSNILPLADLERHGLESQVEDLSSSYRERYLRWSEQRLTSVLQYIAGFSPATGTVDRVPDIAVFPEGGVPRRLVKVLKKYCKASKAAIFAGTHAFAIDDRSTRDYLELGLHFQEEEVSNERNPRFFTKYWGKVQEIRKLLDLLQGTADNSVKLRLDRGAAQLLRKYLDMLEKLTDKSNEVKFAWRPPHRSRTGEPGGADITGLMVELRADHLKADRFVQKITTLIELTRLRCLARTVESPSVLPVLDFDKKTSSVRVRLRLKTTPSPFEITSQAGFYRTHAPRAISVNTNHGAYTFLPLVCSEALQTLEFDPHDIAIIVSYNANDEWFKPVIQMNAARKAPTVYCNDGRFGCSTVRVPYDLRNNNWWFDSPNNGRLPTGDAILIMEVFPNAAPQMGTTTPAQTWRFVTLASIVPGSERARGFNVSKSLRELRTLAVNGNIDLGDRILGLLDLGNPLPVQERNLRHLYSVSKPPSTAFALEWRSHGEDCIIGPLTKSRSERIVALDDLEAEFASELAQRLNSLLAQPGITPEQTDVIIRLRKEALSHMRDRAGESVLDSISNAIRELREEADKKSTARLNHRLGSIVEWLGGTSGWLLLLSPTSERKIEPQAGTPIQLALERHSELPAKLREKAAAFSLEAVVVHNSPGRTKMAVTEGISGWVARNGTPYLNNCIQGSDGEKLDPYYKSTVPSSRAIVSVPLFVRVSLQKKGTEDRLIGVLTVEANEAGAFLPASVGHLQVAASRLIPDLVSNAVNLSARQAAIWHPSIHGWNPSIILETYCYALVTGIPGYRKSPALGASLWYCDWGKKRLYVVSTSRFDFEYQNRRTLPQDSFIGHVSQEGGGDRAHAASRDHRSKEFVFRKTNLPERFRRPGKARLMDLEEIYACAAYNNRNPEALPLGVLCLYFFRLPYSLSASQREVIFTDSVVRRLARYLGNLFSDAHELRKAYALAEIRARMLAAAVPGQMVFRVVRECIERIFDSQGCAIFLVKSCDSRYYLELIEGELDEHTSSQTGSPTEVVEPLPDDSLGVLFNPLTSSDADTAPYYLGITNYLAYYSGECIRKIDSLDPRELVKTSRGVSHIAAKGDRAIEKAISDGPRNARFLGCSIKSDNSINETGPQNCLGIIRMLRTGAKAPFHERDADLLAEIGELLRPALLDWKREREMSERGAGESLLRNRYVREDTDLYLRTQQLRALDRIFHHSSGPCIWNRRLLDAVLQDLLMLFRDQGAVLSNVRFATLNEHGQEFLRLMAGRSRWSSEPADEEQSGSAPSSLPNIGWRAISLGKVLVYEKDACSWLWQRINRDSDCVKWGICAPILFFAHCHSCRGVISLDFMSGKPSPEEVVHIAETVVSASRRLMMMAHSNAPESDGSREAMRHLRENCKLNIVDHMTAFTITLLRRDMSISNPDVSARHQHLAAPEHTTPAYMRSFASQFGRELNAYGTIFEHRQSFLRVCFPLYISGLCALWLDCDMPAINRDLHETQEWELGLARVFSQVTSEWHNVANSFDGITKGLEMTLVPDAPLGRAPRDYIEQYQCVVKSPLNGSNVP
jgi:hypothetical protein